MQGWPDDEAERAETIDVLAEVLAEVEAHDTDYEVRYFLVLVALTAAVSAGLDAGFRFDPADPGWPVAYIELPPGPDGVPSQVSWHMPAHKHTYDGHTTEQKYARVRRFIDQVEHHQNHEADRG